MKDLLVVATYIVVLFSVIAQAGTIAGVVRRVSSNRSRSDAGAKEAGAPEPPLAEPFIW
ncbi:NhaP-type Na+/H+ or K+/H+ antiporter [Brevundimonas bullata]|uniref:NhaP-type Na+/H+ or K+/H+ antiporter n=1 Tax=Brevundimonas bullata TaxID=13160 RepID=A0A7W7N600_9CAUL|nr:hypothetical protein [Brevundimonas bullata]MBB4799757.1 NhaP-type Na+/H+ or K+/H+ antiporter [Brevundimonas bullata]MBB6384621.1 NhaP-type Na+/H+ or K+/H+ antiporter [Brevundimonas bullata]